MVGGVVDFCEGKLEDNHPDCLSTGTQIFPCFQRYAVWSSCFQPLGACRILPQDGPDDG